MTTFEQFAKERYASLQRQRTELYEQLRAVQKEIEEIEKASRASGLKLLGAQNQKLSESNIDATVKKTTTMKEAAVEILRKHPSGLLATEILAELNEMLGTDYVRSSLSPQLSRLKRDGVVFDTRGVWSLAWRDPTQREQ